MTIEATGYGSLGAVTEMLPAGFSYVSSSLVDEGEVTIVDDLTVRFTLQGRTRPSPIPLPPPAGRAPMISPVR